MTILNNALFTLAGLLVVFYVIHQSVEPVVKPTIRVERKITPITQEQRARLSVLASYALASRK